MFGFLSKKKSAKPKSKAKKKLTGKKRSSSAGTPKQSAPKSNRIELPPKPTLAAQEALIRDALREAEHEEEKSSSSKTQPRRKPAVAPKTDREKIIAEALAIQKSQSRLLDDLDPKMKEKVQRMAVDLMIKPNRKPDA